MDAPAYAELVCATNFSFLRASSHPYELVETAAALGLAGLGICDRNSLGGVVRAYAAARDIKQDYPDFRLVVGSRIVFDDGTPDIVVYPTDRNAYGRLCALLTRGNRRAPKGECHLQFADLLEHAAGQLLIVIPDVRNMQHGTDIATEINLVAPGRVWIGANTLFLGNDRTRLNRVRAMCDAAGVPMLAHNDVLYHQPDRSIVLDVLTCIRLGLTVETAGRNMQPNDARHIKSGMEMAMLFCEHRQAIDETIRFLSLIHFSLDQLKYNYPEETIGDGETAQQTLERLAYEGASWRYPKGIPEKVSKGLAHELALIAEVKYAPYFLTVQDIVRFARQERGILCQGRGSAANSAVCFCLGITEVDPMLIDLLFEGSCRRSGMSRPISMSISSTSGAKR